MIVIQMRIEVDEDTGSSAMNLDYLTREDANKYEETIGGFVEEWMKSAMKQVVKAYGEGATYKEIVGEEQAQQLPRQCIWTEDGEFWQTGCGNAFFFDEDGPAENAVDFCPFCGGQLVEAKDEEGDDHGPDD